MNNKIKELAEQAGYTKDMFGVGHWDMPECKKFAELIVQDCIMLCEEWIEIDKDFKKTWVGVDPEIGPEFCIDSIKNHFGIE
jgi:hypothetical protein